MELVDEVVEVTAGPMSKIFWNVNEIKLFRHSFLSAPRVFWTVSALSLVPKFVDSNCGAGNVLLFTIYFLTKFAIALVGQWTWRID